MPCEGSVERRKGDEEEGGVLRESVRRNPKKKNGADERLVSVLSVRP